MSAENKKRYGCPECEYEDGDPLEIYAHIALEHGHVGDHIKTVEITREK